MYQPQPIMLIHVLTGLFQIHLHNFKRRAMIENLFKQPFVQQKLHHMLIKRAALLKAENMIFAPGITTCVDNGINAAEKNRHFPGYTVSFHTSPVFEQIHIPRTLKNNKKGAPKPLFALIQ